MLSIELSMIAAVGQRYLMKAVTCDWKLQKKIVYCIQNNTYKQVIIPSLDAFGKQVNA